MARQFQIPANLKPVQMFAPKTTNATLTSQVISLKNAHKAWIVLEFTQAVGHATTPTLKQATSIAAGTNKAGPTVDIWANEDTAATDTLVKQTAGASYAVTNDARTSRCVRNRSDAARCRERLRLHLHHDRDVFAGDELRLRDRLPAERLPAGDAAERDPRLTRDRDLKRPGRHSAAPVFPHTGNRTGPRTWPVPNSSPASNPAACFPSSISR
jgi:hypothetical protein